MTQIELVNEVGVKLISAHASDDMVAMAAWVSHDADSEARLDDRNRVEKLIAFLYRNRHMSPFEHGQFIFKVDVPLFVAREFMRHRTASYNEVSGRYTVMKPRFYVGGTARVQKGKPGDYFFEAGTDDQTAFYLRSKERSVQAAWDEYESRIAMGIAKEQAREDLPLSLMTQFYVTMNPRNLMHFLSLRNDTHALKEIRDVAVRMEEIFADAMPFTYEAYRVERERQENPVITDTDLIAKLKERDNEITMLKAEVEALGSQLLELQQECIKLRKTSTPNLNVYLDKLRNVDPEKIAQDIARIVEGQRRNR